MSDTSLKGALTNISQSTRTKSIEAYLNTPLCGAISRHSLSFVQWFACVLTVTIYCDLVMGSGSPHDNIMSANKV